MKKITYLLLALMLVFTGCSDENEQIDGKIIVDQTGREVTIPEEVTKIVSCYYTATSSFIALGEDDKLVGIEKGAETRELYEMAAPQLLDLPAVGSGKGLNIEETLALDPDVVVMPVRLSENVEILEQAGIAVVLVNPESIEELLEMFEILAVISDSQDKMEDLVAFYDESILKIQDLQLEPTKNVYLSSNSSYLSSATSKMYQKFMIETAGGIFVANDLEDSYWVNISPEQLQNYNPDVWLSVYGASYKIEEILNDERFSNINAVKNQQVYTIPSRLEGWDYPTPSAILGILYTANILHEDKYTDEMLENDVSEFYKEFYEIEFEG